MKERIGLALAALLLAAACKRGDNDGSGAVPANPAASGSAAAGSPECEQYAKALCEKAGEGSPDCSAMRELATVMAPAGCAAALGNMAYTEDKLSQKRKPCTKLIGRLCKDLGEQTESCALVRAKTPSFPAAQCTAMLEQYAGVLGELQREEAKNKPLDAAGQERLLAGAQVTFGSPSAKAKLVVFSDFECPFCAQAARSVDALREKYGDDVYIVFRQFPLDFHENAHLAAQASLAANAQGKFWAFHDKVFQNQRALGRADLEQYAKEVGLDLAKFTAALDQGTYKEAVDREIELGRTVQVQGTPTAFLNGKRVPNIVDTAAAVQAVGAEISG